MFPSGLIKIAVLNPSLSSAPARSYNEHGAGLELSADLRVKLASGFSNELTCGHPVSDNSSNECREIRAQVASDNLAPDQTHGTG